MTTENHLPVINLDVWEQEANVDFPRISGSPQMKNRIIFMNRDKDESQRRTQSLNSLQTSIASIPPYMAEKMPKLRDTTPIYQETGTTISRGQVGSSLYW